MSTTVNNHQFDEGTWWDSLTENFKESNWIDWGWDWIKTIITKSAEPFLTAALVWSGIKLGDPKFVALHPTLNNIFDNGAFIALDGAAIGLLDLAAHSQNQETADKMRKIAKLCFGLMIFNFSFSGAASYFGWPASNYGWLIILLLIARGLLTVFYIHIMTENRKANKKEKKIKASAATILQAEIEKVRSETTRQQQTEIEKLRQAIPNTEKLKTEITISHRSEIEKLRQAIPNTEKLKTEITEIFKSEIEKIEIPNTEILHTKIEHLKSEIPNTEQLKTEITEEFGQLKFELIDSIEQHYLSMYNTYQQKQIEAPAARQEASAQPIQNTEPLPRQPRQITAPAAPGEGKIKKIDRAIAYVREQRAAGHEPSIEEIKAAAQCGNATASDAKNAVITITEIEASEIETAEIEVPA